MIPSTVVRVGEGAFYNCSGLKAVYFQGHAFGVQDSAFNDCPNVTLYYRQGAVGWTSPTWNDIPTAIWQGSSPIPPVFPDLKTDAYYYTPVAWAVKKGITSGTSKDTFSPDQGCTRGQIVTFLWRAMGSPEPESKVNPYADIEKSDYFYKAVLWAKENDITRGTGRGNFSPDQVCTRAQAATFLWRALGCPYADEITEEFTDLEPDAYYTDAVLWAVSAGITNGTGKGCFSPEKTCTRGQIVTFLYRAMG